jgi:hypothetical protein
MASRTYSIHLFTISLFTFVTVCWIVFVKYNEVGTESQHLHVDHVQGKESMQTHCLLRTPDISQTDSLTAGMSLDSLWPTAFV